jgi:hypothetical protein
MVTKVVTRESAVAATRTYQSACATARRAASRDETAVGVNAEPVPAPGLDLSAKRFGLAAELDLAVDGLGHAGSVPSRGHDRGVDEPDETERPRLRERAAALENPRIRLVQGDPDVTTVIFVGEPRQSDKLDRKSSV